MTLPNITWGLFLLSWVGFLFCMYKWMKNLTEWQVHQDEHISKLYEYVHWVVEKYGQQIHEELEELKATECQK